VRAPSTHLGVCISIVISVRLACVNWYGPSIEQLVVGGLEHKTMDELTQDIRDMGTALVDRARA
jgi:hypothetical protein